MGSKPHVSTWRWGRSIAIGSALAVVAGTISYALFDDRNVTHAPENSISVEGVSRTTPGPPGIYTAGGDPVVAGSIVRGEELSPFLVRTVADTERVKCVLDGKYLGTVKYEPYAFQVAPPAPGSHIVRCTVRSRTGSDSVTRVAFTVGGTGSATPSTSVTPPQGTTSPSTPSSPAFPSPPPTTAPPGVGHGGDVVVSDAVGLQAAMRDARPGTVITLRDGTYNGKDVRDTTGREPGRFVAATSGTAAAPITIRGSREAILDGGGTGGGYALHLTGANHWRLEGFTVSSASKGIVLDRSNHNVIDGVRVTDIGDEGVHFRSFSSDNTLTGSTVDNTGVDSPNYGEGVYIGSAKSNWAPYSDGQPDRSDRNQVVNNTIVDTAAENIDIKEGSSQGVVRGNTLGGDKIASKNSADSWIDVKGNGYLIDGNRGHTTPRPGATACGDPKNDPSSTLNPFCEGFQVHVQLDGWGRDNTFANNRLEVNAPGAGIWLQNSAVDANNVIACSNVVVGAKAGPFATNHYQSLPCR